MNILDETHCKVAMKKKKKSKSDNVHGVLQCLKESIISTYVSKIGLSAFWHLTLMLFMSPLSVCIDFLCSVLHIYSYFEFSIELSACAFTFVMTKIVLPSQDSSIIWYKLFYFARIVPNERQDLGGKNSSN